jgi:hypothetical protein
MIINDFSVFFCDLNRSRREVIDKQNQTIHSFFFFCTGILEVRVREKKKERGSNKLLHTPIEHEIIKKKETK